MLNRYLFLPTMFAPDDGGGAGGGNDDQGGAAGATDDKKGTPPEGNLDELPAWARDAITKANREAAGFRTKVKELEPLAQKAKELEDANKTESQRLTDELTAAKADGTMTAAQLLRLDVALDKAPEGMAAADVRRLAKRLQGATREELEADADDLFKDFGGTVKTKPPARRPAERLHAGGGNDDGDEPDIAEILKKIPR